MRSRDRVIVGMAALTLVVSVANLAFNLYEGSVRLSYLWSEARAAAYSGAHVTVGDWGFFHDWYPASAEMIISFACSASATVLHAEGAGS